ncbi:YesK-like family protein [Bacillus inaquosorum]|uniref:YesK-like family protein n=1 Tax=Bacillus inaquosorum TaxID=483913 RepID=UPI002281E335|nr:YesK-like family protein [Bacillus inaquosorum]MCY8138198.1 YesK-like family protein [Bacillus inaquosorum]MCY8274630.1 YesK-like family protein [Bacillus inaquosorum]MCY8386731.1 YesK-like family protein [Bacillus inaquosorum]MCY8726905.1 YesK-like family protein [Bacillus inaquosorum]
MWPIFLVIGIVTACLFASVSFFVRMKLPDRRLPEWMLAGLVVLGVFAIWYSFVFVRGWEGAVLGMLGFNVICGSIAGYLIGKVIRRYRKK